MPRTCMPLHFVWHSSTIHAAWAGGVYDMHMCVCMCMPCVPCATAYAYAILDYMPAHAFPCLRSRWVEGEEQTWKAVHAFLPLFSYLLVLGLLLPSTPGLTVWFGRLDMDRAGLGCWRVAVGAWAVSWFVWTFGRGRLWR